MAAPSEGQSKGQSQAKAKAKLQALFLETSSAPLVGIDVGDYDPSFPKRDESIPIHPQMPVSPFAVRFGISGDPFWRILQPDHVAHSGLAPEFPNANNQPLGKIPKPNNIDLDRLFYGERQQVRERQFGPKSWQLPVLHDRLSFGKDGDDPSASSQYQQWLGFRSQAVKIDRDRWLSCFKADHWYDLRTNLLNSLRSPIPGLVSQYIPYGDRAWWSMDNEAVASNIELALEIASRVFRQLCSERNEWLDALLFAPVIPCGQDPEYRFSKNVQDNVVRIRPRPIGERATADELWSKMETLTSESIFLGFTDSNDESDAHGATRISNLDFMVTMITFNTEDLLPLLEMDSTVAERCTVLVFLAHTILHEMAHAIYNCRPDCFTLMEEPYYDEEWICELGQSFENAIWGGVIERRPINGVVKGRSSGYCSHLVLLGHPGILTASNTDDDQMEKLGWAAAFYEDFDVFLVPTFWVSAFICEKYWTDVVASRGSAAFRPPKIISSRVTVTEYHNFIFASAHRHKSPDFSVPEFEGECKGLLNRWETKNAEIAMRRYEWYNAEYASWQLLPWSDEVIREAFYEFKYYHTTRNLLECRKMEYRLKYIKGIISDKKASTPNIYAMQYLVILLMYVTFYVSPEATDSQSSHSRSCSLPWNTPVSSPPPAPNGPVALLWPSSGAKQWFDSNTDDEQVVLAIADQPEEDTSEFEKGYYTSQYESQLDLLNDIHIMIQNIEYHQGGPGSWLQAITKCYIQIRAERESNPDPNIWTSFTFDVPPYSPGWIKAVDFGGYLKFADQSRYDCNNPNWRDWAQGSSFFVSPPGSPPPPPPPGTYGVGATVATRVQSLTPKYPSRPLRRPYPRYFYISHVANHRSLDNAWIVEPDGSSGFNVFRITSLLEELGATENDYREVVITGPQGPALVHGDRRAEVIRARLNGKDPIGKLILLKHAEEIAEYNGQNGQPACVSFGRQIYDITNFPFQQSDYRLGLPRSAGGPIPRAITKYKAKVDELLRRLDPYLCAYLEIPQPAKHMEYFTPKKLRWYDNPDLGMYIAINGIVFDITTYLRFHPGGNRLLLQYTGRDATQAFQEYHNFDIMKFYESIKVGYLVPEIEMKDMGSNHVAVHDWVYDISALANEDPGLYEILRNYCSVDTTVALSRGDNDASALATLSIQWKALICAGLAKTDLPDFPRGELKNYNNHRTSRGALVVVNGYVYNTTQLMRYPDLYERALGPNWAGRELSNRALSEWLATNFDARRIARLVEGPAWEKPDVNVDPEKAYAARKPKPGRNRT